MKTMSHFTVLVVGENPEHQLAPFQENNMDDCPEQFMAFHDQEDEFKDEYENKSTTQYRFKDQDEWYYPWDKELTNVLMNEFNEKKLPTKPSLFNNEIEKAAKEIKEKLINSGVLIKEERPFKVMFETFEQFCEGWHGRKGRDEETGKYGYWENPNAKWDWYQLGGRWTGFFKLKVSEEVIGTVDNGFGMTEGEFDALVKLYKENHGKFNKLVRERKWSDLTPDIAKAVRSGKRYEEVMIAGKLPTHKVGRPGLMTEVAKNGYADQAYKKDIDFDVMYREEEQRAHEQYDRFEKATKGIEPAPLWEDVRKQYENIDDARKVYHDHPWNKALHDADIHLFSDDPVEYFCIGTGGRDAFVSKKKKEAITTFAVLMNGKWYERGSMGWWGCVSGKKDNWDEEFYKLFESIPDDTLLSVVDCHI